MNFKKLLISLCLSLIISNQIQAIKWVPGEDTKRSVLSVSGFVQNQIITDSYESVKALDGTVLLYPKSPNLDSNGKDINEAWSLSYLSITSRARLSIYNLKISNVNLGGIIEADFTGGTTHSDFRLRHSYMFLSWNKSLLLMGQTWHPLMAMEVAPLVITSSLGAPYQAFSRAPQILYNYNVAPSLIFQGALVFQNEFQSNGPNGSSASYQRNGVIPNMDFQLQFHLKNWRLGVIWDAKWIKPSLYNKVDNVGITEIYKTTSTLFSESLEGYIQFKNSHWEASAKTLWGQNLTDLLLFGGYAVKSENPSTGDKVYTPSNDIYSWANVFYINKQWKLGVFGGYAKNLGFSDNINGEVYGRSMDLDRTYRISPSIAWIIDNFSLTLEPEMTRAYYGIIQNDNKGKIDNATGVTDYRLEITARYSF